MRIVCLADTHGLHRQLEVPTGDLLIHAGDFTFYSKPPSVVSDFDDWLGSLPHRHKVVVPGNHEFALEEPEDRGAIANAILLVDSGVQVEGMKISPLQRGSLRFGTCAYSGMPILGGGSEPESELRLERSWSHGVRSAEGRERVVQGRLI